MASLKGILGDLSERFLKLGGAVSPMVKTALRRHRRVEMRVFVSLLALLVVGVVACAMLLLRNQVQARSLALLIGFGTGGVLEGLRRVWRDWSQTDLLLILVEDAGEAQVAEIVKRLIRKL